MLRSLLDKIMSPDPLRDADYENIKKMDKKEFRIRLLYDLESMFGYMRWWMWVMGGVNSVLLTILIGLVGLLFREVI